MGNETRNLPACSIVPQPRKLPRALPWPNGSSKSNHDADGTSVHSGAYASRYSVPHVGRDNCGEQRHSLSSSSASGRLSWGATKRAVPKSQQFSSALAATGWGRGREGSCARCAGASQVYAFQSHCRPLSALHYRRMLHLIRTKNFVISCPYV
jgi:hypothetical protein